MATHSSNSKQFSVINSMSMYNAYVIILCLALLLAAIVFFMRRLGLFPTKASMKRVTSISLFSQDNTEDVENGILYQMS